jgi:hypothetical protein
MSGPKAPQKHGPADTSMRLDWPNYDSHSVVYPRGVCADCQASRDRNTILWVPERRVRPGCLVGGRGTGREFDRASPGATLAAFGSAVLQRSVHRRHSVDGRPGESRQANPEQVELRDEVRFGLKPVSDPLASSSDVRAASTPAPVGSAGA